jgi:predicted nucleic acid-binding protein
MNGNNVLLDTNIVLYLLNGEKTLIPLLEGKNLFLSFISQLELLSARSIRSSDLRKVKMFISECTIIDINQEIKEYTIQIRQSSALKLPDSIILGTSQWLNIPLITADKDFKSVKPADLIYFEV